MPILFRIGIYYFLVNLTFVLLIILCPIGRYLLFITLIKKYFEKIRFTEMLIMYILKVQQTLRRYLVDLFGNYLAIIKVVRFKLSSQGILLFCNLYSLSNIFIYRCALFGILTECF